MTGKGEMWKPEEPETREVPMRDDEKEALKDEIIALQKDKIRELTRAILEKAPELGKYLRLED